MKYKHVAVSVITGLLLALAGCGGGGSSGVAGGTASGANATSSGAITAFGSVFVNGREFSTVGARVIDDDTGSTSTSAAGLEVGEVVDVVSPSDSASPNPIADELHVHPLARGYVDASDTTAGTLTVMGQTVQVTSSTNFSDHRACAAATTSPCTAITGQSGLTATTGSGSGAVPGSFVTVHGYLFTAGSSPGATNIVATLVSVGDAPTNSTSGIKYKAEGVVTSSGNSLITIGGLSVDLSSANCYVAGADTGCASAFSTGQVVSVYSNTEPNLPATTLVAGGARLSSKLPVEVAGASVEIEGSVSSVTSSPATFILRGVTIDASALPTGTSLPAVGDRVRVLGTVASDGQSITAASLTVLHAARAATYGFEGDASNVVAGSAANTYVLTLLGQDITVTADTRLADRSTKTWDRHDPANNPFNIATFQSYLAASGSQHLLVSTEADTNGNLTALSLVIVPSSATSGITGIVDASPAPVNSGITGTPSTFAVHGLAISADPAAILQPRGGSTTTVAAGDRVIVLGTLSAGTLTVTATPSDANEVIDLGVPRRHDIDGF